MGFDERNRSGYFILKPCLMLARAASSFVPAKTMVNSLHCCCSAANLSVAASARRKDDADLTTRGPTLPSRLKKAYPSSRLFLSKSRHRAAWPSAKNSLSQPAGQPAAPLRLELSLEQMGAMATRASTPR